MENQEREDSRACITINEVRERGWRKPKPPATCRRTSPVLRLPGNRFLIKGSTGAHPGGVWLYHSRREKAS